MNTKNLNLICIALLSFNLYSPVRANVINFDTTFPKELNPTLLAAGGLYIGYNYLIRQEYLVAKRYPYAQTWYEDINKKYPDANLSSINFIQKPKQSLIPDFLAGIAGKCSWHAGYNHIYFSDIALQEISYIYKKVLDGYPLDENEEFALARREFMLLHEAGHIAHCKSKNIITTVLGLLLAKEGVNFIYNYTTSKNSNTITEEKSGAKENILCGNQLADTPDIAKKILSTLNFPTTIPGIFSTAEGAVFMAGLIAVLRHGEEQADQFAIETADTQTLERALTLFENNTIDKLFELEHKEITPFIQTESTLGNLIQKIIDPIESTALFLLKQIGLACKSTPTTHWLYDFSQDALHEGPSIRAQKIKDEIIRRNNQ